MLTRRSAASKPVRWKLAGYGTYREWNGKAHGCRLVVEEWSSGFRTTVESARWFCESRRFPSETAAKAAAVAMARRLGAR